ncbi:patatin-like phospholipase family protein [Fodinibius sp. Rm-B-1B1-1]|uniref:patatin-like phospholipase family protein n=1 Tax=Fodinibius alkaliphilus TaxID=3140241 RepID=UPI00315B2240
MYKNKATNNMHAKSNKTALVLCGGGAQGAAEIGFYQAMVEQGVKPDYIIGTSIGAINGAFIASGLDISQLKELWKGISEQKLYRFNPELLWKWGNASSLFKPTGIKHFLKRNLPVDSFEELDIPLTVVATDLQKAGSTYIDKGKLQPALLASCALPVYFPPQIINGNQMVDGGITNNIPIDKAYDLGADAIYCMLSDCRHQFKNTVNGLFNMIIRTAQVSQHEKLRNDIQKIAANTELYLLDLCINTRLKSVLDFSKTEMIIEEAYQFSKQALEQGYGCIPLPVE